MTDRRCSIPRILALAGPLVASTGIGVAEIRPIRDPATRKPLIDAEPHVAIATEHEGTRNPVRGGVAQPARVGRSGQRVAP